MEERKLEMLEAEYPEGFTIIYVKQGRLKMASIDKKKYPVYTIIRNLIVQMIRFYTVLMENRNNEGNS